MKQIIENATITAKVPISKTWLEANEINSDSSTILNYKDAKDFNLLQSNYILIDESQTELNQNANELFFIERGDQKYLSWINIHRLGYIELHGLSDGSETKCTIILSEIIDRKVFNKEVKVIGKAFPIVNQPVHAH